MNSITGMDIFLIVIGVGIAVFLFFLALYSEDIIRSIVNGKSSREVQRTRAEEARTERTRLELEAERQYNTNPDNQT